jgi:hypothetical protein
VCPNPPKPWPSMALRMWQSVDQAVSVVVTVRVWSSKSPSTSLAAPELREHHRGVGLRESPSLRATIARLGS